MNPYSFIVCDIFVWFPAAQFPGHGYPTCPSCKAKSPKVVKFHGWGEMRDVVMRDRVVKLITGRYKCHGPGCAKGTFRAYDKEVLALYPEFIRQAFPFYLSVKKALHRDILFDLADARVAGESIGNFAKRIIGMHKTRYFIRTTQYYSIAETKWLAEYEKLSEKKRRDYVARSPKHMISWTGKDGCGIKLSRKYLSKMWKFFFSSESVLFCPIEERDLTREDWITRQGQKIDGSFWAWDHHFAFSKKVVSTVGDSLNQLVRKHHEAVTESEFTLMNEYAQIVLQTSLLSNSISEAKPQLLKLLNKRYAMHGFQHPVCGYSDCCCHDRPFIEELLRESNASLALPRHCLAEE